MTNEEAKKMLKAKLECLKNETSGINHDCNMQLCDGCSLNYEQGNMGEQKEALKTAIKVLEQQPKMGKWILCDTQLPPKDKNVLVTRMYKGKPYVEIAEWNDGWTSYSDEYKVDYFTEHQVVAWMPLPQPYQPPTMMCEED